MIKDVVAHENIFSGTKMGKLENKKELIMALEMTIPTNLRTSDIVFVCIGTDRSTGDALGPMVGTMLEKKKYNVMGTIEETLNAVNLSERLSTIEEGKYIVAIDACLGKITSVGTFNVIKGSLKPGAGVGKQLESVGDTSITACVNVGGFMEYFVLQNTRLSQVISMSQTIASAIHTVMRNRVSVKLVRELVFI